MRSKKIASLVTPMPSCRLTVAGVSHVLFAEADVVQLVHFLGLDEILAGIAGPTVSLCSNNSTVPSKSPSTYRSSLLKIWPTILTAFPMLAMPLRASASNLALGVLDTGAASFFDSE